MAARAISGAEEAVLPAIADPSSDAAAAVASAGLVAMTAFSISASLMAKRGVFVILDLWLLSH